MPSLFPLPHGWRRPHPHLGPVAVVAEHVAHVARLPHSVTSSCPRPSERKATAVTLQEETLRPEGEKPGPPRTWRSEVPALERVPGGCRAHACPRLGGGCCSRAGDRGGRVVARVALGVPETPGREGLPSSFRLQMAFLCQGKPSEESWAGPLASRSDSC